MINMLDMCAGIGTFSYANTLIKKSQFDFIGCCEIDSFCNRLLDSHGHELFGPITYLGLPEADNPICQMSHELDEPSVEVTGITTITHEDICEGVVDVHGLTIGFPCQNISPSATGDLSGVGGSKSNIVFDAIDFASDYELDYLVMENSSQLPNRGLEIVLKQLDEAGYACEWEQISAAPFGYPHYRHRTFLICYRDDTAPFLLNEQVMARVTRMANKRPGDAFPLVEQHTEEDINSAVILETKGNFRRDRVGALGNAVVLDKAVAILQSLSDMVRESHQPNVGLNFDRPPSEFFIEDLEVNKAGFRVMPKRGFMHKSRYFTGEMNKQLCPSQTAYKDLGMLPTLLRSDMKNNFTSTSRVNRPGGLGGLVGSLQHHFGFTEGGLHPQYCEQYLGFPAGYTAVNKNTASVTFKTP